MLNLNRIVFLSKSILSFHLDYHQKNYIKYNLKGVIVAQLVQNVFLTVSTCLDSTNPLNGVISKKCEEGNNNFCVVSFTNEKKN